MQHLTYPATFPRVLRAFARMMARLARVSAQIARDAEERAAARRAGAPGLTVYRPFTTEGV